MEQQPATIYEAKIYFAGIPRGQENFAIGLNISELGGKLKGMGFRSFKQVEFLPDAQN
jgi:hypothetical protein